jgi:hypothetical protein
MPYLENGTGYQTTDTSRSAGRSGDKVRLRDKVLRVITNSVAPIDSETIARHLSKSYRSIQPRTSELKNEGLIQDSGERTMSSEGQQVICWELVE